MAHETRGTFDGEVLGVDNDGSVIQWDEDKQVTYNSGMKVEEFDADMLSWSERNRLLGI